MNNPRPNGLPGQGTGIRHVASHMQDLPKGIVIKTLI
jgi:hypothetical protein